MTRVLDFRAPHFHLGSTSIAAFATKPDALAFAKSHGWSNKAYWAANRFSRFWVVVQCLDTAETLRVLLTDGTWVDLPWPGYAAPKPPRTHNRRESANTRT